MENVNQMVAFVREPHDMYGAIWRYLNQIKPKKLLFFTGLPWHPFKRPAELFVRSFTDWVKIMLDREPAFVSRMYENYIGPDGGEFCWFVGRVEKLEDDFFHFMRLLGYGDAIDQHEEFLRGMGHVHATKQAGCIWPQDLWNTVSKIERPATRRFYGDNFRKLIHAGLV